MVVWCVFAYVCVWERGGPCCVCVCVGPLNQSGNGCVCEGGTPEESGNGCVCVRPPRETLRLRGRRWECESGGGRLGLCGAFLLSPSRPRGVGLQREELLLPSLLPSLLLLLLLLRPWLPFPTLLPGWAEQGPSLPQTTTATRRRRRRRPLFFGPKSPLLLGSPYSLPSFLLPRGALCRGNFSPSSAGTGLLRQAAGAASTTGPRRAHSVVMPQMPPAGPGGTEGGGGEGDGGGGGGGDDLGAPDELIPFQDEGEEEAEKGAGGRGSAHGDLDELKSSLVHESENRPAAGSASGSDSEAERAPQQPRESFQKPRDSPAEVLRRQQDGGFFKGTPYPSYPFLMIPELGSPYLPSGALSPSGARTYLQVKWPLLDVPAGATLKDARSPSPAHLSNKVPVVQHAHHMHPLTPLITYSNDHFSPGSPPSHLSPEIDPKTGIPRPPHPSELSPYYPLSPGAIGQIPHPLGWLVPQQGQPVYSIPPGGFRHPYPALAMNASMSSLMSSRFSPHMVPPPAHGLHPSGIPHPTIVSPIVKQEPIQPSMSPEGSSKTPVVVKKEEEKKPHIKKPLNAFMLYMKEMRAKVVAECTLKESAAINQILGRRWHSLSREEQAKYYELARKERQLHSQLYPTWSARDNYGKKKKRKREKQPQQQIQETGNSVAVKSKKPCVTYLPAEKSCDSPASSHGSMLDSPATPSTALASPAAPAATHSEQAQPLSLTTKPEARAQLSLHSASFLSSKAASSSSSLTSQSALLSRPLPFTSMPPTALLSTPPSFTAIPSPQAALAMLQAQPLSLVTKPAE